MSAVSCVACGNRDITISYFKLPKEMEVRNKWLKNCGVLPSCNLPPEAKICALHFAEDAFSIPKTTSVCRRRLRKLAEPSLRVEIDEKENSNGRRSTTSMWRRCFVCGRLPHGEKRSMFRFPLNVELKEKWLKILDKEKESSLISKETRLCSIHFVKSDIFRHPRAKKAKLRCGALPVETHNAAVFSDEPNEVEVDKHEIPTVQHSETNTNKAAVICEATETRMLRNETLLTTSKVVVCSNSLFEMAIYRQEVPETNLVKAALPSEIMTSTTNSHLGRKLENTEHTYSRSVLVKNRNLFKEPSYIRKNCTSHLATLGRAKRSLTKAKQIIVKQRLVICSLRKKLQLIKKRCKCLEDVTHNLK